jgi:release factor glutamine methyltransferase
MGTDAAVIARLRSAGCVFAEEEAGLLSAAAGSDAELDDMVGRRAAGEPLEQVIGWAEFYGLRIVVDPGVFVPRRRSEFLVAVAVEMVRERHASGRPVIADLCCGTGALGLAVTAGLGGRGGGGPARPAPASLIRLAELHAADLDPAAVECARRNLEPAGGHVYVSDLFESLPPALRGRVDVLICNAPYVPTAQIAFMPAEAREHEALMALDGGTDGLAILRRAAAGAPGWLAPHGLMLVETSERQAAPMAAVMAESGLATRVHGDEWGATVITGQAGQTR